MEYFIKGEKEIMKDELEVSCGLEIKKGEKKRLLEICNKYGIPITYPRLFDDDNDYILWGISNKSVGLLGVVVMNQFLELGRKIFYSLDELEEYLVKRKQKENQPIT